MFPSVLRLRSSRAFPPKHPGVTRVPVSRILTLSLSLFSAALALAASAPTAPPTKVAPPDSSAQARSDTASAARPGTVEEKSANALPDRLGERVYMKNCANCHRADGRGGRQPTATGDPAPNFRTPEFWKSKTDEVLIAKTENGVPNSSMVAWKGILRREEILAVVQFLRRQFEPKGGKAEPEALEFSPEQAPQAPADSSAGSAPDTSGVRGAHRRQVPLPDHRTSRWVNESRCGRAARRRWAPGGCGSTGRGRGRSGEGTPAPRSASSRRAPPGSAG